MSSFHAPFLRDYDRYKKNTTKERLRVEALIITDTLEIHSLAVVLEPSEGKGSCRTHVLQSHSRSMYRGIVPELLIVAAKIHTRR